MKTTRIFLAQFYFGFFIVVLLGARPLPAATLTVTNLNDSGAGSLRQAIADASPGDTINIAATGTIALTSGQLIIAKDLIIRGPGQSNLAVDTGVASRVFKITNGIVTLSDFTIRNATPIPPSDGGGSALLNLPPASTTVSNLWISGNLPSPSGQAGAVENWGTLTIIHSTLTNNTGYASTIKNYGTATLSLIASDVVSNNNVANGGGIAGAILNQGIGTNSPSMIILDCCIRENSAAGSGGAILNYAASLIMSNTVVAGNSSTDDAGGALWNQESGTVELISCSFSNNYARRGAGAIWNLSGNANILNCMFTSNSTGGGDGGAIYSSGSLLVSNSTFVANFAVGGGAGIANAGLLAIIGTTISSNVARSRGCGVKNFGVLTMTDSTISGNLSPLTGPTGIWIDGGGVLFMTNSTITSNDKGGILAASPPFAFVFIRNSIVAENSEYDLTGYFVSGGHNLIGNIGSAEGFTNGVLSDLVGTNGAAINPMLGPLQDNGGPTWTHALLSGSPAIDSGNNSGLTIDQRGHQRAIDIPTIANASGGDGSDIGAFEVDNLITSVDKVGSNVRVSFITSSNQIYRVENSIVLPATNWTTLANIVVGTGGVMSVTNFGAALLPKGFYRVRAD